MSKGAVASELGHGNGEGTGRFPGNRGRGPSPWRSSVWEGGQYPCLSPVR